MTASLPLEVLIFFIKQNKSSLYVKNIRFFDIPLTFKYFHQLVAYFKISLLNVPVFLQDLWKF